jgi:sugar phosphate isomerase/epimerase
VKLSLSQISTVNASFEEDVAAYAAAGFDGIGIWEMKLPPDDEASIALLRETGLGVANCVPVIPSVLPLRIPGLEGPPDPADRIAALCASMNRLAPFEPESVVVLTGPALDERSRGIVLRGLYEVAEAAAAAGVRLGLEPAHPSQHESVSFVNWIDDSLALLAEAGLDHVGLMADTYNLWNEPPDALAAVAGRVTGLHVADEPRDPDDTGRALPGEGGTRSFDHIAALQRAGWDGYLDVEIFSTPEGFWGLPVEEAARRAHAAISGL